jgi:hypothetical protein
MLVIAACSGSGRTAPTGTGTIPSETPLSATASPVVTPAPSAEQFASTVYPYALTLPTGVAYGSWRPAFHPVPLDQGISTGSASDDEVSTIEGDLFVAGAKWTKSLDSFEHLLTASLAEVHQCQPPIERKLVVIASVPAVGMTQTCGSGVVASRVLIVHDGYALAISLVGVGSTKAHVILDELVGWLAGWTWRTT